MNFFDRLLGKSESRSLEDPAVSISSSEVLKYFGMSNSITVPSVTIDRALGIPAYWCGVNFLSSTVATLPLQVFEKTSKGRRQVDGPAQAVLHDAANDDLTSYAWRKYCYEQYFTGGRAFTWVEKDVSGKLVNLWPLEPSRVTVRRVDGVKTYKYRSGNKTIIYQSSEIIDLAMMMKEDQLSHYSPILQCAQSLGLMVAATEYGLKFFSGGGVPPFVIQGNFTTPGAVKRASDDLMEAVQRAAKEQRIAVAIPTGHEIKPIGIDPEKSQLEETQRFGIEQVARILGVPPVFLQDLTHGSFANTEQQDLFLVKHRIGQLCEQFEQEINLKIFGRGAKVYAEMNLDGLLRGDYKSRMEGYSIGIQHGIYTPDEVHGFENLPKKEGSDKLFMQGAMMPIDRLGMAIMPKAARKKES